MTNTFTARKLTFKENFKEHAETKLKKLEKFFSESADTHVTVTHEKDRFIVEITIKEAHMIFRSEHTGSDLIDTFDDTIDGIIRQIQKNKTRLEKKLRNVSADNAFFEHMEAEEDFKVVRSKKFTIKPLDIEEAIMQMNLIGHQFFVFENAETGDMNVVYRRNSGDYGLIEPNN